MKRIAAVILCMLLAFALCACGDEGSTNTEAKKTEAAGEEAGTVTEENVTAEPSTADYYMNEDNAKLLGRTYTEGTNLWLTYSGSGVEFTFTGTCCDITFLGDDNYSSQSARPRVAVYVNGVRVGDYLINDDLDNYGPERTVNAFTSETEETVTVKVVKLSEVSDSSVAISRVSLTGTAAEPYPTAEKDLKIEFIGDSITCGYGVDGEYGVDSYCTGNEDCTKAYAIKTAEQLDADYSIVAMSGHGIISGYTGDPATAQTGSLVPDYYTTMGHSWTTKIDGLRTSEIEWDFSRFTPDVVVINLGTNDASYCKAGGDKTANEKKAEFESLYVDFLKVIREKNPDALICCTLGIMGQDLYSNIENAAAAYTEETGDTNIVCYKFAVQDTTKNGLAVDWHPSEASHTDAAMAFAEFLTSTLAE